MTRLVTVRGLTDATADEALAELQRLFPADGEYAVDGPVAKGAAVVLPPGAAALREGERFQEWWLERLVEEASGHVKSVHDLVWNAVLKFLGEHGGRLTDAETLAQLETLLFDLRSGLRWSIAAPIPTERRVALRALGFSERQQLDFASTAYRMGLLDRALTAPGAAFTWAKVLEACERLPILPVQEAAINVARQRAAQFLTPIVLKDGNRIGLEAAERERRLIRSLTRDAVRAEMHPKELARQFYRQFDREGLVRDWERVARTEIAEARVRGAFEADRIARHWDKDTLLIRGLAANPCSGCLLLHRNADGTPRQWKLSVLEAEDAKGFNDGPWRSWHPRVGVEHPNCCCPPWAQYQPALKVVYERDAARWRGVIEERGLHKEKAA